MFQRRRVVPSLAERLEELRDGRAADLGLDVVPRGAFAVSRVEMLGLRIA